MKDKINCNCDLCGSHDAVEIPYSRLYTNNQPIHICTCCGFVYVKHRRASAEIAKVWSDEIYGEIYTAVKNPAMIARQTFVAEFLASKIDLHNKKVCDIGAGEGYFLKYLKDNFSADVLGIEPSFKNCKRMESLGIAAFDGTIEQYVEYVSSELKKMDIVSIMWTLENCFSCIDMLKGASSLLKEGGKIIVATGSRILVPFKKPLNMYLSKNPSDSHSFRFSINSLSTALSLAGFKVIEKNHYIDSDILCVIAEKSPTECFQTYPDNPLEVISFFERWHQESLHYVREK
jgi:2-polyprenyl-3-methyl-5-hydroxy-6-metoxy-1,4-benzoquinol methylase